MKLLMNKVLKTFTILFTVTFLIEVIFKIVMNIPLFDWTLIRIIIGLIIIDGILSLLISLFNRIVTNVLMVIIALAATIYSIVQAGFYSYLGTYMSVATASQAGAVGGFIEDFFTSIKFSYYFLIIPFILLIVYLIVFERQVGVYQKNLEINYLDKIRGKKKKQAFLEEQKKKNKKVLLITRLVIFGSVLLFAGLYYGSLIAPFMQNNLQLINNIELFKNPSMPNIAASQFGINGFAFIDLKTLVFPYEMEEVEEEIVVSDNQIKRDIDDTVWIEANEKETNKNYKKLNNYFLNKSTTLTNEYTGVLEGKNLIVIMIESGSNVLMDYPEYFPNINKLYNEGWAWTNAFSPRNACSTGNNEMSGLTSLYTINRECTANIYKDNTYFEAMFNLFNNKGYKTSSYHDYTDHFYERHVYHPNMGSGKFYGVEELGITLGKEYQPWPSDVEFIKKSTPHYVNEDKFMVWLTTVSSHMSYINPSVTGEMNLKMFENKDWDIALKRYMSKLKIVDDAIGELVNELKLANKFDDTVIAIYADHEPYGLAVDIFEELAKYDVKKYGNVDRTPFIIYNSTLTPMKKDDYTSFMDLLPTIANLFNLDFDPRLYGGHDLFDKNHPNVVVFADGSWRSDIAYYDASTGKISYFSNDRYTDVELKKLNNRVSNEMKMDNLAIKENYFEYLGKILEKKNKIVNNDVVSE